MANASGSIPLSSAATFSIASGQPTSRKYSPFFSIGFLARSKWWTISGWQKRPLTQSCPSLTSGSGPAFALVRRRFLWLSSIWHPIAQNGQVETWVPSGRPSHLEALSASAPVGQTSTQAPQNSQPASLWSRPKAGAILALGPRKVKARTALPRTSWHIRTHRPQRMQRL